MNYDIDELFHFWGIEGGYSLEEYLKKDDPTITELEIPAEYRGSPVTCLHRCFREAEYIKRVVIPPSVRVVDNAAFFGCKSLETAALPEGVETIGALAFRDTNLKSIVLPKSLKMLNSFAFAGCTNLESVIFNSAPSFGKNVFYNCHKLPADITLMGFVNSCNLGEPFDAVAYNDAFNSEPSVTPRQNEYLKYTRPDVFELAVKNNCFRSVDISVMLKFLIRNEDAKALRLAEKHSMLDNAALLDMLTEYSSEQGKTELTAFLLELKKRKFGFDDFNGGDKFEL